MVSNVKRPVLVWIPVKKTMFSWFDPYSIPKGEYQSIRAKVRQYLGRSNRLLENGFQWDWFEENCLTLGGN